MPRNRRPACSARRGASGPGSYFVSESHTILVSIDAPFLSKLSEVWVEKASRAVVGAEVHSPTELHVLVTDDETVRELNRQYAGADHVTDVLSFSLREGEEFIAPDDVLRLGEVIISYPTAERQAQEAGVTIGDEIAHLLTHGILHLLGYDHGEPGEARRMRAREAELLGQDIH